jgi:hypothetical protein
MQTFLLRRASEFCIRVPKRYRNTPVNEMPKRPSAERITEAEEKANRALADANEAQERGARKLAEKLYERGQRWLDKANGLRGWN